MRFQEAIKKYAQKHDIDPAWLAVIVDKESDFDPKARRYEDHHDERNDEEPHKESFKEFEAFSDKPNQDDERWEDDASYGLCQLMGYTAIWLGWEPSSEDGFHELYDPTVNLNLGAEYLSHLYSKYPEIKSSKKERLRFATGAFNAGRGNINKMLSKARRKESQETGKSISINDAGKWQTWEYSSQFLVDVTGDWSRFTLDYIEGLNNLLPEYREEFALMEDAVPKTDVQSVLNDIRSFRDEIKAIEKNMTNTIARLEQLLEG